MLNVTLELLLISGCCKNKLHGRTLEIADIFLVLLLSELEVITDYKDTFCLQLKNLAVGYRKNSKIWDTSNNCHNCPKNNKV